MEKEHNVDAKILKQLIRVVPLMGKGADKGLKYERHFSLSSFLY